MWNCGSCPELWDFSWVSGYYVRLFLAWDISGFFVNMCFGGFLSYNVKSPYYYDIRKLLSSTLVNIRIYFTLFRLIENLKHYFEREYNFNILFQGKTADIFHSYNFK